MNTFFKRFSTPVLVIATVLLVFVMFELIGVVTGTWRFDLFARSPAELLFLNSLGVALLLIWIGVYIFQLFKESRRRVPGTKFAMRILRNIALITLLSMAVVYVFSFFALSRGIDDWFKLQVGEAVEEANQLRVMIFDSFESNIRNDLNEVVEELATLLREDGAQRFSVGLGGDETGNTENAGATVFQLDNSSLQNQGSDLFAGFAASDASELVSDTSSSANLRSKIFELIFDASQSDEFEEVTYFEELTSPEAMVVSSSTRTGSLLPVQPSQWLIEQHFQNTDSIQSLDSLAIQESSEKATEQTASLHGRRSSWELLTGDDGRALLRMLIPIPIAGQTNRHYLQVLTILPSSSQRLAERVSLMNERHERLEYLRNPLKVSFVLALTFVTLMAILLATWVAIGLTRQLVAPIRTLSEGTIAVAAGRYEKLESAAVRDDLGVLVDSFNEMTEKIKKSQEEIRESQTLAERHSSYLEIVLKHLSSGVVFIDKDNCVTNINLATESILQVKANEVRDTKIRDIGKRNFKYSPLFASIAINIQRKVVDWSETVKLETDQGEQILSYSVTELPLSDSAPGNYVVVIEDITALVQAQRGVAWREVARRMAHEMLNPLQPIQLAVERIQYKTKTELSDEQSRSLELSFAAISRQLNALHRIVKEFQNYSRPVTLRTVPLNMNDLIREVIELHAKQGQDDEIHLDLDPDLAQFHGDPDKLVQVFNNLINNAKEATRDSGKLVLRISTHSNDHGNIDVWVIDNGPGFRSDVLDRIFEPYATTKKQGMGFGLEIVKRIVEAHGGSVTARNNPDGAGAQFRLEFAVKAVGSSADSDFMTNTEYKREATH